MRRCRCLEPGTSPGQGQRASHAVGCASESDTSYQPARTRIAGRRSCGEARSAHDQATSPSHIGQAPRVPPERLERLRKTTARNMKDRAPAARARTTQVYGTGRGVSSAAGDPVGQPLGARVLELPELDPTDLAGQRLRKIVDEFDLTRVRER